MSIPVSQFIPPLECLCTKSLHTPLFGTVWTVATRFLCPWGSPGKHTGGSSVHGVRQASILEVPLSMGFTRQAYWSGFPCNPGMPCSSRAPSHPGVESVSLSSPALAGRFFTVSAPWEAPSSPLSCGKHMFVFYICNFISIL